MPYFVVKDFQRGLDARRMLEATEVGALIEAKNCHITRGGEAEKRKAFVEKFTLPAGTHGLWAADSGMLVFGSIEEPAGLPAGVGYARYQHPDESTAMHRVLSQDSFYGKPYVVAEFVDGTVHHYHDGERIQESGIPPDFEDDTPVVPPPEPEPPPPIYPVGSGRSTTTVRFYFVQGGGVGTIKRCRIGYTANMVGFILGNTLLDGRLTNPIVDESLLPITVSSNNVGAGVKALADLINAFESTPNCHARANGNELVVSIADYGTEYNGWFLNVGVSSGFEKEPHTWAVFLGGQDMPQPEVPEDVEDPPEEPPLVPEEFLWSPGRYAVTHRQKVYATSGNLVYFSAVNQPAVFTPDAFGANFIDVTTHSKGSQELVSIGEYQDMLALLSAKQIGLWKMDPDPRRDQLMQVLHATGTLAPRSVTEYGTGDMFYLDKSGIRSLSARAMSNTAYMSDIGSMIDTLVTQKIIDVGPLVASRAIGLVEPEHGRLWMIVGDLIYVLSFFPTSKISAWTIYEPGFNIDYADTNSTAIYVRSGNDVYVYGGDDESTYDDCEVVVQLPFLDFQRPGTAKKFKAMDAALLGTWRVQAAFDATRPNALATVGELSKSTYSYMNVPVYGKSSHLSLRFVSQSAGPARIGAAAIHYNEAEAG